MALYSYQAFSKAGARTSGTIDATSLAAARDQLSKMGMFPIKISLAEQEKRGFSIKGLFQRGVSMKDKILFTRQLAVLLRSGIPLLQALELLVDQFSGRLHRILVEIKDGIKEGQSLANGLARYPKVFENIYVQLVRAGEAAGNLEIILERLVEYMERRQAITKKVKGALSYPLIQLVVVIIVVIFLLTAVVPKIATPFKNKGVDLPVPTRILLVISDFVRAHYIILLGSIIGIIILFLYWKSTKSGSYFLDKIKLKIPVISYFTRMGAVVQFSRTLGMLMEGGVNLSEALDIVVRIVDNQVLARALSQARDKIVQQGKIAQFLQQTGLFPSIAIYLIRTGEESGQLPNMLLTVAKNYEEDLQEMADNLSKAIEPIMLIVMALIVGFIVMSVALPIVRMSTVIS